MNAIENDKIDPALPLAFHIEQLFGQWIEDNFER
jgi:DNA-binding XRE family transcriptional regulator